MEEYTHQHFYEHPSISAVIACHCTPSGSKSHQPDEALENRMKKLEDKVNEQKCHFDSLESRLSHLESKKEITPPKGGRGNNNRNKNQP
jgi:hypothetical protein